MKQITLIVKGERPNLQHIVKALFKADGSKEPRTVYLAHCEERDLWIVSTLVEFEDSLSLKITVSPPGEIHNRLTMSAFMDITGCFDKGQDHVVMEAEASFIGPFSVNSVYAVDRANMIFMNKVEERLVQKDTVISLCGSIAQLHNWNHPLKSVLTGHGTSLTAVQLPNQQQIQYKNVISEYYVPSLFGRVPGYMDPCNCVFWEPAPYWNKTVDTPDDGNIRFVWSQWGNVNLTWFDAPLMAADAHSLKPRYKAVYKERQAQQLKNRERNYQMMKERVEKQKKEIRELMEFLMTSSGDKEEEKIEIVREEIDEIMPNTTTLDTPVQKSPRRGFLGRIGARARNVGRRIMKHIRKNRSA